MLAYCTYCSAEKNITKTQIPAIELYKSERIAEVHKSAKEIDAMFIILSGKYGIVSCNENIDYYDHLLVASEVEAHSELIASQIKLKNISEIAFFMNSVEKDGNLHTYLDCIEKACDKAEVSLEIKVVDFQD